MRLMSLFSGLLFGLGLAVSGMLQPDKVQGFLDLAGVWDPSLALVMAGAIGVFMPGYFLLVKPRRVSVSGEAFHLSQKVQIEPGLLFRITSYNVCYTKLLRPCNQQPSLMPTSMARTNPTTATCPVASMAIAGPGQTPTSPQPIVITSYSIHYTKLYERRYR